MKYVLALMMVCHCAITTAQQTIFVGKITDEKNSPIPFAIIQAKEKNQGTYSDDDGVFTFECSTDSVRTLVFSCIGYEKKEIPVSKLSGDTIRVKLKGNVAQINEVTIAAKKLGPYKSGLLGKPVEDLIYRGQVYFNIGDEMAIFLPAERRRKGIVKEVNIYVTKIGVSDSRFRLHVYEMDPDTERPGKDITGGSIIASANIGNEWVKIDLSDKKIPITEGGVYIGIEWISGYGNEEKARWRRGLFDYHSPVVGFTQGYGGKAKRYCRLHFSQSWSDGEYLKYRLSPMVYGSYLYRD